MTSDDTFWDDLFHACSFTAMISEARKVKGWPDSEAVKREANRLYEAVLAEKNTGQSAD